eukprot:TRINITY_DN8268_c0_g1_i1.p1 TRINITY_DN8268_c0_g1~~TRINITY_DN8268_c0_g1_i1.p1  ORF type:complete len:290 (-),score=57.05 TRINITY_DN8268_c0_g1_i1:4-849(-)
MEDTSPTSHPQSATSGGHQHSHTCQHQHHHGLPPGGSRNTTRKKAAAGAGLFGGMDAKVKPRTHEPGQCAKEDEPSRNKRLLTNAVKQGKLDQVKSLINSAPYLTPELADAYGETLVHHAAFRGQLGVLSYLLEQSPDLVHTHSAKERETPLHRACRSAQKDTQPYVIQMLLRKDALVDDTDRADMTPLMRACYENNTAVVEILLKAGASTTAVDATKATALHWACYRNSQKQIIDMLVAHGADVNHKNMHGESILDVANEYSTKEIHQHLQSLITTSANK